MCRLTMMDKRIINRDAISNCFSDSRIAKIDIGKKGYFSKSMYGFHDLESCVYGELVEVKENTNQPFIHELYTAFDFFIPESAVAPKKKLRPFTLEEFIHTVGDVGGCVRYRRKDDPEVFRSVITEIRETSGFVVLGNLTASFDGLFNEFEYYDNGAWIPFGVVEDE